MRFCLYCHCLIPLKWNEIASINNTTKDTNTSRRESHWSSLLAIHPLVSRIIAIGKQKSVMMLPYTGNDCRCLRGGLECIWSTQVRHSEPTASDLSLSIGMFTKVYNWLTHPSQWKPTHFDFLGRDTSVYLSSYSFPHIFRVRMLIREHLYWWKLLTSYVELLPKALVLFWPWDK